MQTVPTFPEITSIIAQSASGDGRLDVCASGNHAIGCMPHDW